eukprot:TRINITY_DN1614_c0_g2_i1.p2 TRINITY_DN1614_c0_g2~~TRINITY_DN1614_c0_g2_i1.p2  ORF type:complete len:182 (+),score=40.89 TRINITY_DN1614_c0_g2_i1:88-633(+)
MSNHPTALVSRYEVLDAVRRRTEGLSRVPSGGTAPEDASEDAAFWKNMTDQFFVQAAKAVGGQRAQEGEERGQTFDDMLFFVRQGALLPWDSDNLFLDTSGARTSVEPFFVRRWGPELDKVAAGADAETVDWQRSFFLNLICHSSYSLKISVCSKRALEQRRQMPDLPPIESIYEVGRRAA